MNNSRVVITGLGVVSSIGTGIREFAQAIKDGKSGAAPITIFDTTGFESNIGCQVRDFKPDRWVKNLESNKLGRCSQFSIAAAYMAIEDARLEAESLGAGGTCGVSIGTTDGESALIDQLTEKWSKNGPEKLQNENMLAVPANRISSSVAQELRLSGEAVTIPTACAAGNYAIGHAFDLISAGEADFMLCGGADAMCRKTFAGFYRLGTIAPTVCQPFDKNRKGLLTGEGAGILFLERFDSAVARGAYIYAEILGYGLSCDAYHMVSPDKMGIANCMRIAHRNAGIAPAMVDYISAHGTGTQANDWTESQAIIEVFGDHLPPVSSVKSMLGHTMGASSALATIACCVGISNGFIPPTINHQTPDPDCIKDCVPNKAREKSLEIVQSNAFAFGGNNAIVILSKCKSDQRSVHHD